MSVIDNFRDLALSQSGFPGHVLSFDPGETTGWAWFHDYELVECGQIPTGEVELTYCRAYGIINKVMLEIEFPQLRDRDRKTPIAMAEEDQLHIAIEDYRVYSWKADDHSWGQIHTIKVVGILELMAKINRLPLRMRMAQHAKNLVTDERLKQWGMWKKGQRHARDAIRHACLYICDYKGTLRRNSK